MKRKLWVVIGLTVILTFLFNLMAVNLPSNSAFADQQNKIEANVSSPDNQSDLNKNFDTSKGTISFLNTLKNKVFNLAGIKTSSCDCSQIPPNCVIRTPKCKQGSCNIVCSP